MTVEDVRVAMADACSSLSGWRAYPYIRDSIAPPEIQIASGTTDYDLVFGRGADIWNYRLIAYVSRQSERSGQLMLDELRAPSGAGSLKTVLEADTALAALIDYVVVKQASEVREVTTGTPQNPLRYLLIEFTVEVCY